MGKRPEFRRRVLDLVEAGRTIAAVAADLQISAQTIYNWRRQGRIDRGLEPGLRSEEHAELVAARKRSVSSRTRSRYIAGRRSFCGRPRAQSRCAAIKVMAAEGLPVRPPRRRAQSGRHRRERHPHRRRAARRPVASSFMQRGPLRVSADQRGPMTTVDAMTAEAVALQHFLDVQRASALAIIEGLTEEQLRTSVLPSGWTPLGLIEHLGHAEHHWFQRVACGTELELPWPDNGNGQTFTSGHPVADVIAFYRDQCERANAVLAATSLDAKPVGRHPGKLDGEITDLRRSVLHMIEETARHVGHLDAARELLDGRTGLGPR